MLSNLILLPWLGILVLAFVPARNTDLIRKIGAGTAALCFVLSLQLWVLFDNQAVGFQFVEVKTWMFPVYFGIDGISLFFVLLTTFFNFFMYYCYVGIYSDTCKSVYDGLFSNGFIFSMCVYSA